MSGPEVHHLSHAPIADHSFSADRQTVAVAKENIVELYGKSGNKFVLKDELKGHDKTVTGVDIAPNSGMIVTCSQGKPVQRRTPSARGIPADTYRSKRLRLGTLAVRLETHAGPPPHQPSRHVRPLVALGEEIRRRLRRTAHCSLLL